MTLIEAQAANRALLVAQLYDEWRGWYVVRNQLSRRRAGGSRDHETVT